MRQKKINNQQPTSQQPTTGFAVAMAMMMDLISCLAVGLGIGILIHKMANASPVVIAVFGLLGGIAGLFSVVQMGMKRGK